MPTHCLGYVLLTWHNIVGEGPCTLWLFPSLAAIQKNTIYSTDMLEINYIFGNSALNRCDKDFLNVVPIL